MGLGNGVLLPFILSSHLKSLGLDENETVIVHRAFAIISTLAPIITGLIADKIGNFKVF
jgi:hypothetical protein